SRCYGDEDRQIDDCPLAGARMTQSNTATLLLSLLVCATSRWSLPRRFGRLLLLAMKSRMARIPGNPPWNSRDQQPVVRIGDRRNGPRTRFYVADCRLLVRDSFVSPRFLPQAAGLGGC